jgi:hypothetical protein
VERLLERKVTVDSELVELATACGHADVLGRVVRECSDFGDAWLIAWLDDFGDGLRVLEAAGARPTWTASGVKLLMEKPGKAAQFAGIAALPEAMVGAAEWEIAELQAVVARLLRDGTATAPVLRALVEQEWEQNGSPFATCSAVEFANLVFPPDATRVGSFAFCGCPALTQVEIPSTVRMIADCAFWRCSGLTQVVMASGVMTIGNSAFDGCTGLTELEIPPSVTTIGDFAFYCCSRLTRVVLPASVTTIWSYAFSSCLALMQVEIPPSVTTIGEFAFWRCLSLTEVVIRSSVATIGESAFEDCSALVHVVIPASMTTIGKCVFQHVTRLERLTLVGSPLSGLVVASLDGCLTSTANVIGASVAGQKFGRFTIAGA